MRTYPWTRPIALLALAAPLLLAGAGLHCARAADVASPAPAAGADELAPETMIMNLSTEVLDTIRNDKAIQAGDFPRVQKLVDERIMPRVDFDKMTRLAVGRAWRGATAEQRSALTTQFRMLLMRTYSGALSKVSDQKVRLRPGRAQDGASDVIVRTQIVASQGDPVQLDYRLEKTAAGWKIYDLNILGVWLIENYKNEFTATLNQGGVDALIAALTQKNQKLAAGGRS
jgi:phospholipid transport system substrate-binding protein